MKRFSIGSKASLVATHALVILFGIWLARQGSLTADDKAGQAAMPGSNNSSSSRISFGKDSRSKPPRSSSPGQWKGSEYARAWKAIRTAGLSTPERIKLQRQLLAKWGEVDLHGAISAALDEAWDGDASAPFGGGAGPLLDYLAPAMAKNPADSWALIHGGNFGVATGMLRGVWFRHVGRRDPLFLAGIMGEVSWRDRQAAIQACRNGAMGKTPAERDEIFKALSAQPPEAVSAENLAEFGSFFGVKPGDPAVLEAEIKALAATDERTARAKAILLAKHFGAKSVDEILSQANQLPGTTGQDFVWSLLRSRSGGLQAQMPLLDHLVGQQAWDKLASDDGTRTVQSIARGGKQLEVADWAASLPVRGETTELFHRSVDSFVSSDTPDVRQWLENLPQGVWRDRAYAEFSQQALYKRQDEDASQWALDQIGDSAFKQQASGWRNDWAKQGGRKEK